RCARLWRHVVSRACRAEERWPDEGEDAGGHRHAKAEGRPARIDRTAPSSPRELGHEQLTTSHIESPKMRDDWAIDRCDRRCGPVDPPASPPPHRPAPREAPLPDSDWLA